jgi:hypothetical protein
MPGANPGGHRNGIDLRHYRQYNRYCRRIATVTNSVFCDVEYLENMRKLYLLQSISLFLTAPQVWR